MRLTTFSIAALLTLSACAGNPPPVPFSADPAGSALIVGDWSGTFYTGDAGRAGSIVFQFHQRDTTGIQCLGDVVMSVPAHGVTAPPNDRVAATPEEVMQVLSIDFVDVHGHEMSGALTPYRDLVTG